jgi:hypothetical protein
MRQGVSDESDLREAQQVAIQGEAKSGAAVRLWGSKYRGSKLRCEIPWVPLVRVAMVPTGALEQVVLAGQVRVAQQIRVRPKLVRKGAIKISGGSGAPRI